MNSALREVFDGDDLFMPLVLHQGVRHDGILISSPFEGLIDTSKAHTVMLDRARNLGLKYSTAAERVESGRVYLADSTAVKAGKILVCTIS